jgi:hypothetical protein
VLREFAKDLRIAEGKEPANDQPEKAPETGIVSEAAE